MVYVTSRKRCEQAGCSKYATYNFEGEERRRFCGKHKEEGMVLVKKTMLKGNVVVTQKICQHAVDDYWNSVSSFYGIVCTDYLQGRNF